MPKTMDRKRTEAEERKEAISKLTPQERLSRLATRPGDCTKERYKLLKLIEEDERGSKKRK